MLRLMINKKNTFKKKFYKFEIKKIIKIIYFSVLLFVLALSSLYFFGK